MSESSSGQVRVPDLGPPPVHLKIDVETVRHLVSDQFPQWSHLDIESVSNPGWDNVTSRLGDGMLVRLPSAAEYASAVEKEQAEGPRPGIHNWYRGATLLPIDATAHRAHGGVGRTHRRGSPACGSTVTWPRATRCCGRDSLRLSSTSSAIARHDEPETERLMRAHDEICQGGTEEP